MYSMTIQRKKKLKYLLENWPKNTIATNEWLESLSISRVLKSQYITTGWVKPIGQGAIIRTGDKPSWEGGLYALQKQLDKRIHLGARSALEKQGVSHYIRFDINKVHLFTTHHESIQRWFTAYNWDTELLITRTNILPWDLALEQFQVDNYSITISSVERAIIEMLALVPQCYSFEEAAHIMEHLTWLRPIILQPLLENCSSIKAKRLFMYLGDYYKHKWMKALNVAMIDLGSGKRSIAKHGKFINQYKITIPKDFIPNEKYDFL
jgi:hypothetical protein